MVTMVLSAVGVAGVTVHAEGEIDLYDLYAVANSGTHALVEKHAVMKNSTLTVSEFEIGTDPVFGIRDRTTGGFTELKENVDYTIVYIGRVFNHSYSDVTGKFDKTQPGDYTFKINGINSYKGTDVYVEGFTLLDPTNPDPSRNYTGTPGDTTVGGTTVYATTPYGTTIKKVSKLKKGFKVTWNKTYAGNAEGYQIRYSLKSSMAKAKTVTVKSISTSSKKITKLKAKKKYYVQIRTYKTVGGKKYCSEWSAKKIVKTK